MKEIYMRKEDMPKDGEYVEGLYIKGRMIDWSYEALKPVTLRSIEAHDQEVRREFADKASETIHYLETHYDKAPMWTGQAVINIINNLVKEYER